MLTDKAITEFQKIWLAEYDETITREKAINEGQRLILLFKTIMTTVSVPQKNNKGEEHDN